MQFALHEESSISCRPLLWIQVISLDLKGRDWLLLVQMGPK